MTTSLRERVRQRILDQVKYGELRPGDKISEAQLCETMGISRTPAREALLQLASEGLLENVPRKGFVVCERSIKEKMDVYDVLAALDALAAKLALKYMGEKELNGMHECIDLIDISIKYRNYPEYCRLQQRFHDVYRERCGNDMLRKLLEELQVGFAPHTYISDDADQLFEVYRDMNEEHRHIVDLFEEKKGDELYHFLMDVHWQTKYDEMI